MADGFNRWSQLVRSPGAVEILASQPIDVPPLGEFPPYSSTRPGLRLLIRPLGSWDLPWFIDITSTQVIAMLDGFLATGAHVGKRLTWTSAGYGSRRKDTIRLVPIA